MCPPLAQATHRLNNTSLICQQLPHFDYTRYQIFLQPRPVFKSIQLQLRQSFHFFMDNSVQ